MNKTRIGQPCAFGGAKGTHDSDSQIIHRLPN
jgi:hypothetical protein